MEIKIIKNGNLSKICSCNKEIPALLLMKKEHLEFEYVVVAVKIIMSFIHSIMTLIPIALWNLFISVREKAYVYIRIRSSLFLCVQ